MKIYKAEDVPSAHKIAVYDALCRHFADHLDRYYTEPGYADPKYDSGCAQETPTETTLIEVGNAALLITMGVQGWADYLVFEIQLPPLTRDEFIAEGTTPVVEIEESAADHLADTVEAYLEALNAGVLHAEMGLRQALTAYREREK